MAGHGVGRVAEANARRAARHRVLQRVADEVEQQALQVVPHERDHGESGEVQLEGGPELRHLVSQTVDDFGRQRGQGHGLGGPLLLLALPAHDGAEVVDGLENLGQGAFEVGDELDGVGVAEIGRARELLEDTGHVVDGLLEVVRGRVHEVVEVLVGAAQAHVLFLQLLLGLFLVVDVGAGAEPLDDAAVGVALGPALAQKPAVHAVVAPEPVLHLEEAAGFHALLPALVGQVEVVRVNHGGPVGAVARRARLQAGVVEPALVHVVVAAHALASPHNLRHALGQEAELLLAPAQLLRQLALLVDVGVGAVPLLHLAAGRAPGLGLAQKPAVLPVVAAQAELGFVVALRGNGRFPALLHEGAVVGVHEAEPVRRVVFFHALAQVGGRAVVVEVHGAVGLGRPHLLRNALGLNAQLFLALGQAFLQAAQLGHVGVGAEPAHHLVGGRVADGPRPAQKPAVLPVVPPQREGVFPGLARGDARQVALVDAGHQLGVVHLLPAPALHFLQPGARVIVPLLVVPEDVARGLGHPGQLGHVVGQRGKVGPAAGQLFGALVQLVNFDGGRAETGQLTIGAHVGLGFGLEPAQGPVAPPHPEGGLPLLPGGHGLLAQGAHGGAVGGRQHVPGVLGRSGGVQAGVFVEIGVGVGEAAVGVEIENEHRHRGRDDAHLLVAPVHFQRQGLGPLAGAHPLGHVQRKAEQAVHGAVGIAQGHVNQVEVLAGGAVGQAHRHLGLGVGFTGLVHVVHQFNKALLLHFGQALGHARAQAHALSRQCRVAGVEIGVAVLGPFHGGDKGGGLGQNLVELPVLFFQAALGVAQRVHVQQVAVAAL